MSVPNTFATATTAIPLANLDANFAYYDAAFSISGTATTFLGGITLNTGTANGVAYLNGSKVVTTGSALTFDGTNLGIGLATPSGYGISPRAYVQQTADTAWKGLVIGAAGSDAFMGIYYDGSVFNYSASYGATAGYKPMAWQVNGSEQMRLTSTGLGIGTSSPSTKLDIAGTLRIDAASNIYGKADNTSFVSLYGGGGYNQGAGIGLGGTSQASNPNIIVFTRGSYVETARFDANGNFGLGVTPSAWATYKALQIGGAGFMGTSTDLNTSANAYFNAGWKYYGTGLATLYNQGSGIHSWYNAVSGTAGNAITLTQAMTLDASGRLGIGTTSPANILDVRNDTSGTQIRVSTSDNGNIFYAGWATGASYIEAAGYNSPALAFRTGGTERMRLDSSGNLGLGVTPSGAKLDISGSGTQNLRVASTSGNAQLILNSSGTNVSYISYGQTGANPLAFYDSNAAAERMRLDSSGNLLVGTTSTGLSNTNGIVLGTASPNFGQLTINHSSGSASGSSFTQFGYNGTSIGSITQSGTTAVLYNLTSDQRLKTNIADAAPASALIDAIQVRQYDWKSDGSHQRYGFIAQELVTVAPEAVHQPADPEEMMAVDYSKLVPMLVKEIQSLRARVAQLESK